MAPVNEGVLLLVDDELNQLTTIVRELQQSGYVVLQAASGAHALELVRGHDVDAVLLDVMMPGMSGLETLRAIRQTSSATALPVFMVTTQDGSDDVVEALELGANDYLRKPLCLPVTVARVRAHVTARRADAARRASDERVAALSAGAQDGLWDWHLASGEVFFSERWRATLGWGASAGTTVDDWLARVHPDDAERLRRELEAHSAAVAPRLQTEYRALDGQRRHRWIRMHGQVLVDGHGHPCRVAGSIADVTDQRVSDALTGLPSREVCHIRLGGLLQQSRRNPDERFAVLSINLDHFGFVNASLGHVAGDHVLSDIAARLSACLRGTDTVARAPGESDAGEAAPAMVARRGGDEFTILIEDLSSAEDAQRVAQRVLDVVSTPVTVHGKPLCLSASIGIALDAAEVTTPEELVERADAAMLRAKRAGGRRCEVFDADGSRAHRAQLLLETDLRWAVERGELQVLARPVTPLSAVPPERSFEALVAEVHWVRPGSAAVSLHEMGELVHAAGMAEAIDAWLLEAVCAHLAGQRSDTDVPVVVPVFAAPTASSARALLAQIERDGVDASRLRVDVSAASLVSHEEPTITALTALRARGVRVGLRQVESAEMALMLVTRMSFDALTFDASLAGSADGDEDAREALCSLVKVARSLGMVPGASGVNASTPVDVLRTLGITVVCGDAVGTARPLDQAAPVPTLVAVPG